ncbi:Cyclin pch1 [Lachnellula suecica]|uniref:Cyclin pch1 n=1 Tax=Lachnellula suecica TaxID=602035 RepID=A0A8T9CCF7_9HELO|nr:Cyclin pch1 [Lachnellula suecica]
MTTIESYRPPRIPSDAPSNARRLHSSSSTTTTALANIPPAVPSPPRLSRDSPPRKPHLQPRLHAAAQTIPHPPPSPSLLNMASDDSSQWIFTDAEILSTPSVVHGIQPKDERVLRGKGSNFILQAGILLKLPQLTIATASVFFQRFYMRCSLDPSKGGIHHYSLSASSEPALPPPPNQWTLPRSISHANFVAKDSQADCEPSEQTIAGTALFLATKTEENCRKTKEVVIACAKVAQKNSNLVIDEQSKEYWRWRDNLLMYEEMMLEFLTFDLIVESPHNIFYGFLHQLRIEENKKIRNSAWAFLNDACHTTMCLQLPAKDMAIGAIYFAAKVHSEALPDDGSGNPWWETIGGTAKKIVKAVGIMHDFYTDNPMKKPDSAYDQSPLNEEDIHRSRRRADVGSSEDTPSPRLAQSQPMQNGHSQQSQSSTAPVNGNGAPAAGEKPLSPKPNAESEGNGSSDAALKAAANDPATHASNGGSNGLAAPGTAADTLDPSKPSPKRKSTDVGGEPPSKRSKNKSDDSDQTLVDTSMNEGIEANPGKPENGAASTQPADESEEGELDE